MKLCAFGPENIYALKVEEIPSFRIVTKLLIVQLERTAIGGVESGISSRIVKSNAPRKESRNRALPFCNLPLIRVENCLQLFDWIRFTVDGNRRKWEYRAPRCSFLCPWETHGSATKNYRRNFIKILAEHKYLWWGCESDVKFLPVEVNDASLNELWVFYSIGFYK